MLQKYLNPLYEPNDEVIWPSVAPQSIDLWDGNLLRWIVDNKSAKKAEKQLSVIRVRQKELRAEVDKLHKELLQFSTE